MNQQTPPLDCVVLAAGASKRFGDCKLLAPFNRKPLLEPVIRNCQAINPARLLMVTGAYHPQLLLAQRTHWPQLELIHYPDWHLGMGHSLAFVIAQLTHHNPVLVLLADQALISREDLNQLINAWQAAPEKITCAAFADYCGVPAIFPAQFKNELLRCTGDQGAKPIIKKHLNQVTFVDLPNAQFDIDTRADLIRAHKLTCGAVL